MSATQNFAASLKNWNGAFAKAYDKMSRIGAVFAPKTANVLVTQNPPNF